MLTINFYIWLGFRRGNVTTNIMNFTKHSISRQNTTFILILFIIQYLCKFQTEYIFFKFKIHVTTALQQHCKIVNVKLKIFERVLQKYLYTHYFQLLLMRYSSYTVGLHESIFIQCSIAFPGVFLKIFLFLFATSMLHNF